MGSRKRSAQQRRIAQFKDEMGSLDFGDAFERERRAADERAERHEEALRHKACESKNRYASRSDAEYAIERSAAYGRGGLRCYRCRYCHGWHLTSHLQD